MSFSQRSSSFSKGDVSVNTERLLSTGEARGSTSGGKTPLSSTIFNMVNAIIGAGVLALPWAFSQTGEALGLVLLVVFAKLTILSCLMVNWCCDNGAGLTYAAVAESAFGTVGKAFLEINKVLFSWGACTGYLVIIGNELEIIMLLITGDKAAWYTERTLLLLIAVLCFILPLALLKDLRKLSFASLFSLCCVTFLTIAILIRVPYSDTCLRAAQGAYDCKGTHAEPNCEMQYHVKKALYKNFTNCLMQCENMAPAEASTKGITGGEVEWFLYGVGIFKALPLFVFAYNCQIQFVGYKYAMSNPTPKRVVTMLLVTLWFCMFVYMTNATGGYTTFCDETLANLLDSYKGNDILILPARACISFSVACSYPLYSREIRTAIEINFFSHKGQSVAEKKIRYYVVTILIVASMTVVAIVFQSLDKILGLAGAIAGSSVVYILPGACFAKLYTVHYQGFSCFAFGGIIFCIFGVALAVICSVFILI